MMLRWGPRYIKMWYQNQDGAYMGSSVCLNVILEPQVQRWSQRAHKT
jgi:hypothetical protein